MATSKVAPGFFEWTRPPYEQVEQAIGYNFKDKGFLVMAFTHRSVPETHRIVPASMDATEVLGDAWLKYFLANKLYGCIQPLTPRSLHDATSHVATNYSFGLAAVRHGWHRLLRTGCARLNEDIVNYVQSIENANYPGDRTKVPPKVLADAFGALFGAVYLDSNLDMAATWGALYPVLQPHIEHEIAAVAAKSALYLF
ncbi:hypothetical protein MTO96_027826 [Rhipicephalus appendiculatus]